MYLDKKLYQVRPGYAHSHERNRREDEIQNYIDMENVPMAH